MPRSKGNRLEEMNTSPSSSSTFFTADNKAVDTKLASLFAGSLGPVTAPPKSRYQPLLDRSTGDVDSESDKAESEEEPLQNSDEDLDHEQDVLEEDEESGLDSGDASDDRSSESKLDQSDKEELLEHVEAVLGGPQKGVDKKRKRGKQDEELEDVYMKRLEREELREEENRRKKQRTVSDEQDIEGSEDGDVTSNQSQDSASDGESYTIPQHESLAPSKNDEELDKASRTVFLGNVSSQAITSKSAKKTLIHHLGSFTSSLPSHSLPHKVESIRFRSTAFASAMPKKAAFVKKEIMDATTKSTNAYAVYSTHLAAREAVKRLNGTVVLDRHLRVDSVAHPSATDHRRCVFVGNLGFVDDESSLPTEDDSKKKKRPTGDVEEGLWIHFSKAGKVESVRVVRDAKTRVGKGFAYVQFEDENGVEAALEFNDQKFPPLLPRKLRVVRAKGMKRNAKKPESAPKPQQTKSKGIFNAKISHEQKSAQGRARKLLGKAAAFKTPETFIFEGHRASSKQGTSGLKLGGKKRGGKPKSRVTKRTAAWRASSGKR